MKRIAYPAGDGRRGGRPSVKWTNRIGGSRCICRRVSNSIHRSLYSLRFAPRIESQYWLTTSLTRCSATLGSLPIR